MNVYALKRLGVVACALVLSFLTTGFLWFGDSDIDFVKEYTLKGGPKLGKVLESYKYVKDGEWSSYETKQGVKVVQFKGKYTNDAITLRHITYDFGNEYQGQTKKFADFLDKNNYNLDFIIRFGVSKKNIGAIQPTFSYNGEENEGMWALDPKATLPTILNNQPLGSFLPKSANKHLSFLYKKYILTNIYNKENNAVVEVVSSRFVQNAPHNDGKDNPFQFYLPIMIYKIDSMDFDEIKDEVKIKMSVEYTDATYLKYFKNVKGADFQQAFPYPLFKNNVNSYNTIAKSEFTMVSDSDADDKEVYKDSILFKDVNNNQTNFAIAIQRTPPFSIIRSRPQFYHDVYPQSVKDFVENQKNVVLGMNKAKEEQQRQEFEATPFGRRVKALTAICKEKGILDKHPNLTPQQMEFALMDRGINVDKEIEKYEDSLGTSKSATSNTNVEKKSVIGQSVNIPNDEFELFALKNGAKFLVQPINTDGNDSLFDCMATASQNNYKVKLTGQFTSNDDGSLTVEDYDTLQCEVIKN